MKKRNENDEIIRYKARLVTQGFSQIPSIDYDEIYSPVMDAITLRYLISSTVSEGLDNVSYGCCYNLSIWVYRY